MDAPVSYDPTVGITVGAIPANAKVAVAGGKATAGDAAEAVAGAVAANVVGDVAGDGVITGADVDARILAAEGARSEADTANGTTNNGGPAAFPRTLHPINPTSKPSTNATNNPRSPTASHQRTRTILPMVSPGTKKVAKVLINTTGNSQSTTMRLRSARQDKSSIPPPSQRHARGSTQ